MLRIVAAAVFVVAAVERTDVAVGLVVLGLIFVPLERWRPVVARRFDRSGRATDVVHALADELIALPIAAAALSLGLVLSRMLVPDLVRSGVAAQPSLVLAAEALVLAEVCGYWGHRLEHRWSFLWRFHKLHHSIETMDWLAPNRRHPVDLVLARLSVALPLLSLGFPLPAVVAPFVVTRFQGLLVHANVRWEGGPMRHLVATPHFHHWHHSASLDALNCNFAGQAPLVDRVFGTLVLPRGTWPEHYGLADGRHAPEGWCAQMLWPFRSEAVADAGRSGRRNLGVHPGA